MIITCYNEAPHNENASHTTNIEGQHLQAIVPTNILLFLAFVVARPLLRNEGIVQTHHRFLELNPHCVRTELFRMTSCIHYRIRAPRKELDMLSETGPNGFLLGNNQGWCLPEVRYE